MPQLMNSKFQSITFTFIHLSDAFIQSDLQLCQRSHASGATRD